MARGLLHNLRPVVAPRGWTVVDGVPDWREWFGHGGVYALYQGGELVYVGRTGNFCSRLRVHARRFPWEWCKLRVVSSTRQQMWFERRLLHRLRPTYNKQLPVDLRGAFYAPTSQGDRRGA